MNIKKYAANLAGTNKIRNEIMDYRTMFPVEKIKFGENLYSCPRDIDQYLYNLYGDFMKLPPKEKQVTHHHFAYLDMNRRLSDEEIEKIRVSINGEYA